MTLGPGIHFDVPLRDYYGDPCPAPSLTQSIAKILLEHSPEHAHHEHPRFNPVEPDTDYDKAKAIGNAVHKILIGRGKDIAVAPAEFTDWRKKEAQAFKADAFAAGREPILAHHHEEAVCMALAARSRLDAIGWTEAFREGAGEVVIVAEVDGVLLRSLVDWLTPDHRVLYDFKSGGGSMAPHVIGSKVVEDGWDIQAAMQERILAALEPENAGRLRHRFPAQENWPPYGLVPVELTEHHLTMGRKKLEIALDLWRRCLAADRWPSYPVEVVRPEYPGWAESKWLQWEGEYYERGSGWAIGELIRPGEAG